MSSYAPQSGLSSEAHSISDLDGFTITRDYPFPVGNFAPASDGDFGFDPPEDQPPKQEYSPVSLDDLPFTGWPNFERDDDPKNGPGTQPTLFDMDKFLAQPIPPNSSALSRYGQMTPPRSNSAASSESQEPEKPLLTERRKRTKTAPKEPAPSPTTTTATSGRKRKSTRKSLSTVEQADSPEEFKRKHSLEKNRLAAAKCRVNKKEKTEQLQRDSHNKAVENAFLKNEVLRLQHLTQQMNAYLLSHTNCDGAEDVRRHLNNLGNDFFSQHMVMAGPTFPDFQQLPYNDAPVMPDSYFPSVNQDPAILNPPLPEFNRTAEFEVHTPMQTD